MVEYTLQFPNHYDLQERAQRLRKRHTERGDNPDE